MSDHTIGKWRADTDGSGAFGIEAEDGAVICTRHAWPHRKEESLANARLIAAAPELLQGLKGIRANLVRLSWEENSLMIEGIDALISKAEDKK